MPIPRLTLLRAALLAACLLPLAGPARASRELFVVDLPNEPASLDPQVQWDPDSWAVYRQIFDTLLTRDKAGQIAPNVATAWTYQSDTQVTFTIRDDIHFQDGSKLTAEDVAFSIKRITDPAFKSPQLSQYDTITSAEVVGPNQVKLTTRSAYPVLLSQLTKLAIVPEAVLQKVGNDAFDKAPVGSGPYRLVSRTRGVKVELAAMPDYWHGAPPFPRVEMHPVLDESTRIADLRTGRADITRIVLTDDADSLKNDATLHVLWAPTERVSMLALNALTGPTKDVRVREAIAHAIDRDLLIEALLKGYAKPVNEPLTPAAFGFDPDIPAYGFDPAKSRALLKEAGIKPGTPISFPTSPAFDPRVVQAIAQMLTDVGLDPHIQMVDGPTYLRLRQGRPDEAGDVSFFRWSCSCQDADGTLFPLFHSSSQWAKYSNPLVDRTLEAARNTLDPAARMADYRTVLQTLHDDVASVPLYQDVTMYVARKQVEFTPRSNELFLLTDVTWHE
jgi:peptide/nickel transport system substrate-binding protein